MARQVHDRDIAAVLAAADQCIKTRVPRVALMAVAILIASGAVHAQAGTTVCSGPLATLAGFPANRLAMQQIADQVAGSKTSLSGLPYRPGQNLNALVPDDAVVAQFLSVINAQLARQPIIPRPSTGRPVTQTDINRQIDLRSSLQQLVSDFVGKPYLRTQIRDQVRACFPAVAQILQKAADERVQQEEQARERAREERELHEQEAKRREQEQRELAETRRREQEQRELQQQEARQREQEQRRLREAEVRRREAEQAEQDRARGYQTISIETFVLDSRELASKAAKVAIRGAYIRKGNLDFLYRQCARCSGGRPPRTAAAQSSAVD
jgi:hypothetical protein